MFRKYVMRFDFYNDHSGHCVDIMLEGTGLNMGQMVMAGGRNPEELTVAELRIGTDGIKIKEWIWMRWRKHTSTVTG